MGDPTPGLITGLVSGLARTGVIDVLVILSLVVMIIVGGGLMLARDPISRLHFLAPVSTIALPLVGIAAVIDQGPTLGSAAVVLAVVAGALSGPVLTTSVARLVQTQRSGSGQHGAPEQPAVEQPR